MMQDRQRWPKPLLQMVARSYSPREAERFATLEFDDRGWDVFEDVCRDVLQSCRIVSGACVIMSALLSTRLTEALDVPVPVVAGAMKVAGRYVYGGDAQVDRAAFSSSDLDWDGHCWALFGRLLVDISLGRTARAGACDPLLARTVVSAFGDKVGLIALNEGEARAADLRYLPRCVLTPAQLGPLAAGARVKFDLSG